MSSPPPTPRDWRLTAEGFKRFSLLCLLAAVAFLCFAIDWARSSGLRSQDASRVKRPAQSCAPHSGATVPVRERGF